MDIQITGIRDPGDGFLYIERTIDGGTVPHQNKMPKESLAIRAAEYNIEPDDPIALNMLLMENFIVLSQPQPHHPLHTCDDIGEALEIVMAQVEDAKTRNGAPTEPHLRCLYAAADLPVPESTQGLTDVRERLLNYCDDSIPIWVRVHRDENRKQARRENPYNLLNQLKKEAMGVLRDQAMTEDRQRRSRTK
jgi:hypothetical protein